MKHTLLRTLLSFVLLPPVGVVAQNFYAYGYFNGPEGIALVEVARITNSTTHQVSTEVFYTFCGQADLGLACQQGDGIVPNTALTGTLPTVTNKSVMTLNVDTSSVTGYRNQLCTGGIDDYGDCVGATAATGGLISVTWTKTNAWANVSSSSGKSYTLGKLTGSFSNMQGVFSATQVGTVIGVDASSGAVMSTSNDSSTLQTQFKAMKRVR